MRYVLGDMPAAFANYSWSSQLLTPQRFPHASPPWPPTKIFFYARLVYVKDLVSFARLPAGPKEGVEAVRRGRRT